MGKSLDGKSLESGDYPVKKFVRTGTELAKYDLVLANLQDGSDTYNIFLLTKKEFEATRHLSGEDPYFRIENIGRALKP